MTVSIEVWVNVHVLGLFFDDANDEEKKPCDGCCHLMTAFKMLYLQLIPLVTELWIPPTRTSTLCGQLVDWE